MVSKPLIPISKEQCRAARGWLGITQEELSVAAGVNQKTIARFETGAVVPYDRTLRDLQACLEAKGIEFLFDGTKGVGIQVRSQYDSDATSQAQFVD